MLIPEVNSDVVDLQLYSEPARVSNPSPKVMEIALGVLTAWAVPNVFFGGLAVAVAASKGTLAAALPLIGGSMLTCNLAIIAITVALVALAFLIDYFKPASA